MGELLPRLSTLASAALRPVSGIFLLHLSWGHPRRALPVIPALWSPDFPHARAFALGARLFGPVGFLILPALRPLVNRLGLNFLPETNIIILRMYDREE